MTVETLSALLFSWMMAFAPPDRYAAIPTYPEATETVEERTVRYQDIADDLAAVIVADVSPAGRRRAAALLLGISWHESGWALDVDRFACAPGRLKKGGCDSGRAKSIFQIQGFAIDDRQDAARIALRLARRSFQACARLPRHAQLSSYAAGTCESPKGQQRSKEIMIIADRLLAQ